MPLVLGVLGSCRSAQPGPGSFPALGDVTLGADELGVAELEAKRSDLAAAGELFGPGWDELLSGARELAGEEPASVPAARLLDDIERASLLGPVAWDRRRAELAERESAESAYLLGRLALPGRARELFDRTIDLDPGWAFGYHGQAWLLGSGGGSLERAAALRASTRTEALAVGRGLVRLAEGREDFVAARELLGELAALPGLLPREVLRLRAEQLASRLEHPEVSVVMSGGLSVGAVTKVELEPVGGPRVEREAYLEALELLRPGSGLADADLGILVGALGRAELGRSRDERLAAMQGALAGREGPVAVSLRMALAAERRSRAHGKLIAPLASAPASLDETEQAAALAFERGDLGAWLAAWRGRLPAFLGELVPEDTAGPGQPFASTGVLRLLSLAEEPAPRAEEVQGALAEAGWFEAAQHMALLSSGQVPPAVDGKAVLLEELTRLCGEATRGELSGLGGERGFLATVAELTEGLPGLATSALTEPTAILASPRESYGPLAALVQPGPRAAPRPEAAPLAGLAALARELGRMLVVGSTRGQLDATLRPVVAMQYLSGEHLKSPFTGTAFWCQGVDAPSRAEAGGAGIAGAAVHAGFWIDLEAVRDIADDWQAALEAYRPLVDAPEDPFPVMPPARVAELGRKVPLLGEARRLQVLLLRERGPASFDELVDLVRLHEEGHLCDRARFLPLGSHWPRALAFLAKLNFSPDALLERLEYRAELVALAEAPDPRLVLFEILLQAESAEANASRADATPHAAAYASLLADLGGVWLERLGAEESPGTYLRWRWHRMAPDELRSLALELAGREGLVGG